MKWVFWLQIKIIYSKFYFRDVLKLCDRLNNYNIYDAKDAVFSLIRDVADCFIGYISNKQIRDNLMFDIGTQFNISRNDVNNY